MRDQRHNTTVYKRTCGIYLDIDPNPPEHPDPKQNTPPHPRGRKGERGEAEGETPRAPRRPQGGGEERGEGRPRGRPGPSKVESL